MKRGMSLRKKRWLYGPLVLIVTIIIFLLVVEIYFRTQPERQVRSLVHSCPPRPSENNSDQLVDFLKCNESLTENPVLYHHPFSLSYNKTKPAGTFRVIFLGDSMTVGLGVSPERRFTALIGQWLDSPDQRCPGCIRYEVLNMGVNGYELEQIEQVFYESLDFEPNLVVYDFHTSDSWLLQLGVKDGKRVVEAYDLGVLYAFSFPGNGWLLKHSMAYRFLNNKLSVIIPKVKPDFPLHMFQPRLQELQKALDGIIDTARQERVPLVIMYIPNLDEWSFLDSQLPEDFIPSRCHSGVMVWDVSQELALHYSPEDLRISDEDLHPSEQGHEALADVLQLYFERYVLNQPTLEHLVPADDKDINCTIV